MEFGCKSIYFVVFFTLCSVITTTHTLECYVCTASSSELDDDACKGIGFLKTCTGNSVCLSASYEVITGTVKTYTTMRTCFPNMAGKECENFIKSQRDTMYKKASIARNSCYTCETDNCNKNKDISKSSSSKIFSTFLPVIICCVLVLNNFKIL